jgi:hypothetical protein
MWFAVCGLRLRADGEGDQMPNIRPLLAAFDSRCPLPAARCPLPAARCPLPAARCPLPAAPGWRRATPTGSAAGASRSTWRRSARSAARGGGATQRTTATSPRAISCWCAAHCTTPGGLAVRCSGWGLHCSRCVAPLRGGLSEACYCCALVLSSYGAGSGVWSLESGLGDR